MTTREYRGNTYKMMYIRINNRTEFVQLLRLGYGQYTKNPWEKFNTCMSKYGNHMPCFDITPPNKFVRFAPRYFYNEHGYTEGTFTDAESILGPEFHK